MIVRKIHTSLYRVCNGDDCKDVWVESGKIKPPENPYNTLTELETELVLKEIKKK